MLSTAAQADSVPFWGAKVSSPIDTPLGSLKKGEFIWIGDVVTSGPVVMVVSITEQRGYVYRNGVLIGATTVSTGRPGHLTPTGVFTVLQKQKEHRSTIYDGSPGEAWRCTLADCPDTRSRTAAFICRVSLRGSCLRSHRTA